MTLSKLNFFDKIIFVFTTFVCVLLLLSYLAPFINPVSFWPMAFLGLGFPILFITTLLFCVYWILRIKIQVIVPLISLLLGYNQITNFFAWNSNHEKLVSENIHVMSYNVRLFDLYNWKNNKQTRNKIFDFLKSENPDIICFQEFYYSTGKNKFNTKDTLPKFLKAKNKHVEYSAYVKKNEQYFGIATYSSYPIIRKGKIDFEENTHNICIYTDLKINEDTIRVYNAHLSSVRLDKDDYNFLDSIAVAETNRQFKGILNIIKRLKKAFILRAPQVEKIKEHIASCPYPVILCSDINDTPFSHAYQQLTHTLTDTFTEKGKGFGITYNGNIPFYRIDFILKSSDFHTVEYQTHPEDLSDHFPISAKILIKK
jgi:endonuclease/exonuclease/phosphatase family metal-dependent hydrolase